MINYKNILLTIIFSIYFLTGLYLSVTTGISHDQYHEQLNWQINFQAIKGLFENNGNYKILTEYLDRYHGIAFHYISQPIQFLIFESVAKFNKITLEGAYLISRHVPVYLIFCLSGYFFYLLSYKISNNKNFSLICISLFYLYPYLFGHALINGKDIPFMSIWIISTYFLFILIEKFYHDNEIKIKEIFIISFLTAFLISIRITGILILLEYLIAIIILTNVKKTNLLWFLNVNKINFLYFIIFSLFFIYILNPVFWLNPMEFFNSISWMGKYYHDICTLTLGSCMDALNLPSSYIFIWLFFKLPLIILLGLIFFPLIENKIFNDGLKTIFYGILSFTVITLLFIFIIKNIALYDEIRHLIFLIPFIFLIGLYNIFILNKKLLYFFSIIVIFFFIFENISLKNYQYTWINSLAKFTNIQKNFEVDYWGISGKELSKKIVNHSEKIDFDKQNCIYGGQYTNIYLEKFNYNCFKSYSALDAAKKRPYYVLQNVRNIKRSNPKDCKLIYSEGYTYTFMKNKIKTGILWYCD